jgi:hypothetical protein
MGAIALCIGFMRTMENELESFRDHVKMVDRPLARTALRSDNERAGTW